MQIALAVEAEVFAVVGEAKLALATQRFIKQQLTQRTGLIGASEVDVLDLATDVTFFIGQKEKIIAVTTDQGFLFQALETVFNLFTQTLAVSVDLIDKQGDQVVDVALDLIDISDEEQSLQHKGIKFLQAWVAGGIVNGRFDHALKEALDRRIEAVKRYQDADVVITDGLGG